MKIGIVDDHPLVREGLISILSIDDQFEFVGEASNCQEGIVMIDEIFDRERTTVSELLEKYSS